MRKPQSVVLALVSALTCAATQAGVLYTWEDERGQVQISDVVPAKYKATARRIDTRQFELSAEQVQAAQAQASALKARASTTAHDDQRPSPRSTHSSASAATAAARPSQSINFNDCTAWRRAFLASRDCFAGFQRGPGYGALRPGAYEACGPEIPNPEPKCGPEKWQ